jgi:hypothetical protein
VLTLLHELGHAVTAGWLTGRRVKVVQGGEPGVVRFSVWRLDLHLRPLVGFRRAWYGIFRYEAGGVPLTRRVVVFAAGPAVSLLAFVALSGLAGSLSYPASWFAWAAAGGAAVQFVVTAMPIRYGRFFGPYSGTVSDGRRILELLRD